MREEKSKSINFELTDNDIEESKKTIKICEWDLKKFQGKWK